MQSGNTMENNKQIKLSWTPIVILLAGVCCLLWGSAFPCIKLGYKFFRIESGETTSQILFAGTRFAIAGAMVIITFSIINRKFIKPSSPGKIATLSVFQTILQYVTFYIGLAHTTGVQSSIINGSAVFITILISCLIFKQEKITSIACSHVIKNRVASGSVNISSFLFSNAYFHFTKTDPVECNTFP